MSTRAGTVVQLLDGSGAPRAANNVLFVLTDGQKAQLVALAREQEKLLTDFAYKRFPLVQAFHRQLTGDLPAGSAGLSREAVVKYTGELYAIDGTLSCRRAEVLGGIIRSLTDGQRDYLGRMVFDNSATWPEMGDQVDKRSLSHGSFYMKDIPAMGNRNYSISTSLTGDRGDAYLYSRPIDMPAVPDTDCLFGVSAPRSVRSLRRSRSTSSPDRTPRAAPHCCLASSARSCCPRRWTVSSLNTRSS